ncbi:isocitrate lyase/PEP mutase family protein [Pseudomonas graminis]
MNTTSAARFQALHRQPVPLRLPNAWDAGSARQIETLGAQAIATTSAGVAWSLGYRDGNQLPVAEYVARAASIARVIAVPLSADVEGGYHDDPATVADTVKRLMDVGVVGINIEDGSADPQLLCRKIEAIRAASISAGVELYINVRTDVYARNLVPAEDKVGEVVTRAQGYRHAGADGLFVLGLVDAEEMQTIAQSSDLLLNVIVWPGLPPLDRLSEYGVRRLSVGSWLPQTLWAHNEQLVRGFLSEDVTAPLMATAAPYSAINALF